MAGSMRTFGTDWPTDGADSDSRQGGSKKRKHY